MTNSKVNICGVPHEVIMKEDAFNSDGTHLGEIVYGKQQIKINKNMPEEITKETICHEMVHGILIHIGRDDLACDETFVQSFANAIYQGFEIKEEVK